MTLTEDEIADIFNEFQDENDGWTPSMTYTSFEKAVRKIEQLKTK